MNRPVAAVSTVLIVIAILAAACSDTTLSTPTPSPLLPTVTSPATGTPRPLPSETPTATRTLTPTADVATETSTPPPPTMTATLTDTPLPPTPTSTATPKPSATPFPIPPPTWTPGGPGVLPTAFAISTPDPSLIPPQSTAIPTPVPLLQQPADTVNILLLGSDTANGSGLTDSMIVVSVDPTLPSVSMLSIPRDLYVFIPGWKMSRINTAHSHGQRVGYPGGGPGLLKATLEYNLGIPVHYYAHVDFSGFTRMIDTLGGVDVVVDCELHDTFPDPDAEGGQSDIDLTPGVYHLDGKTALWYARSRWNTNDYDRARRQQRVLRGMWAQIRQLGLLAKLPELWEDLTRTVDTDLSLENLVWLASVAGRLDADQAIKSRFIDGTVVTSWLTPEGAQVLLPDFNRIGPLIAEALAPPDTNRARQGWARVEVLNGTTWSDWGVLAADRLLWEGFQVVTLAPADRADYQQTLIVDLNETAKGSPLYLLARVLRVNQANILTPDAPSDELDFRVVVGYDFQPCYKSYWFGIHTMPTPTPTVTATP
jgi:LCP family protein required for cell wall assembly